MYAWMNVWKNDWKLGKIEVSASSDFLHRLGVS